MYSPTTWDSPIVQLVERRTVNPYVAGSSPAWGAISNHQSTNIHPNLIVLVKLLRPQLIP